MNAKKELFLNTGRSTAGWIAGVGGMLAAGGLAAGIVAAAGWILHEPPAGAGPAPVASRACVPCGAGWLLDDKIPARLMDGVGTQKFNGLTTSSAETRKYFEQGLALVYGFNHDEARRSFREAARLDPDCAMAFLGIAHTLGTNYNVPGAKEQNEAGTQAIAIARSLSARASEMERALIEATSLRFPTPAPDSVETQAAADQAYSGDVRDESGKTPEEMLSFGLVNAASDVLRIAELVLSGQIEAAKGNTDQAVAQLTEAVSAEDALTYIEPSDWSSPTRPTLGAVLLGAKRFKEAERTFREDLVKTPENGWALFGLAEALKQSGDAKGAEEAMARFAKSWAKQSQLPEFGWY